MFSAANVDHAVSGASFQVLLERPLSAEAVRSIVSRHDIFRNELPANTGGRSVNVELSPKGPTLQEIPSGEFAFLRPDGSPAWVLRFGGQEMVVECTRYTRWNSVSGMALQQLKRLLDLLSDAGFGEIGVAGAGLLFRDDFFWAGAVQGYDLTLLLRPSSLVAQKAFSSGAVWHSHTAWFEDREAPVSTLVHLNVDATGESVDTLQRKSTAQVAIHNYQNVRYSETMQISWHVANFQQRLVSDMQNMHMRNKAILKDLLVPSIADSIGLK